MGYIVPLLYFYADSFDIKLPTEGWYAIKQINPNQSRPSIFIDCYLCFFYPLYS